VLATNLVKMGNNLILKLINANVLEIKCGNYMMINTDTANAQKIKFLLATGIIRLTEILAYVMMNANIGVNILTFLLKHASALENWF